MLIEFNKQPSKAFTRALIRKCKQFFPNSNPLLTYNSFSQEVIGINCEHPDAICYLYGACVLHGVM